MTFERPKRRISENIIKERYISLMRSHLKELGNFIKDYDPQKVKEYLLEYACQTMEYEDVSPNNVPGLLEFIMSEELEGFLRFTRTEASQSNEKIPFNPKKSQIKQYIYRAHWGQIRNLLFYNQFFTLHPRLDKYNILTQTPKEIKRIRVRDIELTVLAKENEEFVARNQGNFERKTIKIPRKKQ